MGPCTKFLIATALLCAPFFAASGAGAVTLTDSYSGGYAPPGSTPGTDGGINTDVVGSNTFQINSLSAYRTANGSNPWGTLNVVVNTFYAGAPEAGTSLGTGYGDLFITPGANAWTPTTSGSCNDCNDVYRAGEWQYVATLPSDPTVAAQYPSGSGMFYSTAGNSQISGSTVGATTGTIATSGATPGTGAYASLGTSNFNGGLAPTSSPAAGVDTGVVTSSYGSCDGVNTTSGCNDYRADQAVGYDPLSGQTNAIINGTSITEKYNITATTFCTGASCSTAGGASTYCTGSGASLSCAYAGTIAFQIVDNGLLGNNFALSWAMTCANDVIQGQVSLLPGDDPVDEPPTWAIVLAGLLSIVAYRRWAKHQEPFLLQYT